MIRRSLLLGAGVVLSTSSFADNGQIAHAGPLADIEIDGSLKDWPENLPRYPIALEDRTEVSPDEGFSASFRAGYSAAEQAVYVALEIVDDVHSTSDDPEPDWSQLDSVIAYVDFNHTRTGSGAALYLAVGEHRRMVTGDSPWDADVANASWDTAKAAVKRQGSVTVYEWRFLSHQALAPHMTLGLDFLVADHDQPGESSPASLYAWGPGFGKSRAGGRTGDLLLLDSKPQLGELTGQIALAGEEPTAQELRVRVSSQDRPQLWLQARADKTGRYRLKVPAGAYEVSSVDRLLEGSDGEPRVLAPARPAVVKVLAGKLADAAPLALKTVPLPVDLPARGALFGFDQQSADALDRVVPLLMAHYQVPGASLALVKDGGLVLHRTYGEANAYSREKVGPDTLFEAASITKAVFAFAVNRLAERGVIDLDRPLHTYLPFEDIAHDKRYQKITARHALSHQTGFPNWRWMNETGKLDIKFYPGIKFGYSGEGFEYLGRVVAHLTGKPLEQVLAEEVLVPLQFEKNTYFSDGDAVRKQTSRGHLAGMAGPLDIPGQVGVAHSMYTEARTFSNFMLGLLAQKGLSADGYEKMYEPQIEVPLDETDRPQWPRRYTLGFHLMNSPFGPAVGHGGNNGDFTCLFEIYPEQQVGFAVFTNADTGSLLASALRDYLIVGQPAKAPLAPSP
ncbi:MAG: serine hydrolase [Pseudomonadota bacterium]